MLETNNHKKTDTLLLLGILGLLVLVGISWLASTSSEDTSPQDSSALLNSLTVSPTDEYYYPYDPEEDPPRDENEILPTWVTIPTLEPKFLSDHTSHILYSDEEYLLSAKFTEQCFIHAISSISQYYYDVHFKDTLSPGEPCQSHLRLVTPHSYGSAVYQDINTETSNDSIRLLSFHHGIFNGEIDTYINTNIVDMQYLSHDKVVVLHIERDNFDNQLLSIYNTLAISAAYPDNFDSSSQSFPPILISEYTQTINLPNIGVNYNSLLAGDYFINVFSSDPAQYETISVRSLDV